MIPYPNTLLSACTGPEIDSMAKAFEPLAGEGVQACLETLLRNLDQTLLSAFTQGLDLTPGYVESMRSQRDLLVVLLGISDRSIFVAEKDESADEILTA